MSTMHVASQWSQRSIKSQLMRLSLKRYRHFVISNTVAQLALNQIVVMVPEFLFEFPMLSTAKLPALHYPQLVPMQPVSPLLIHPSLITMEFARSLKQRVHPFSVGANFLLNLRSSVRQRSQLCLSSCRSLLRETMERANLR